MAKATAAQLKRQGTELVELYKDLYEERMGRPAVVNRYALIWGAMDANADLGFEKAKKVLAFFFKTERDNYKMESFFSCYDVLADAMDKRDADRIKRAKIREETRKRVEALDEQSGTGSN